MSGRRRYAPQVVWSFLAQYDYLYIYTYFILSEFGLYIYICDIILREFECLISSQQIAS